MKDAIIKGLRFIGLGFFEPLVRLISGEDSKKNSIETLKKIVAPIASILLFLGVWYSGSKSLYNTEANYKIAKVLKEQGAEEANKMKDCIASGDVSCQPNTLPSPLQVWESYKLLLKDHRKIGEDKEAFKVKNGKPKRKKDRSRKESNCVYGKTLICGPNKNKYQNCVCRIFTRLIDCNAYRNHYRS